MTETADPILVGHIAQAPILECVPETTVADAVARMRAARCGSILVVNDGQAVGIWTGADVIRLDFEAPGVLETPMAAVMTAPVKTIRNDASIREAAFLFREEGFRHLLVVDGGGRRVGIVSQTDVINNQGVEFFVHLRDVRSAMHTGPIIVAAETPAAEVIRMLRQFQQDAVVVDNNGSYGLFTATDVLGTVFERAFHLPIGGLASYPLHAVSPDASLYQARSLFIERQIRHLVVMDGEELVGLLTYADILECVEQVYLRELHQTLLEQSDRLLLSQHALTLAKAVAESSQQGIVITDAAGVVESVNPAFTAITGYRQDEVLGKNLRILRSERHDKDFFRQIFETLAERGSWSGEIWNRRKDGELIAELMTMTLVRGADGAVGNYVAVFSDITRQKRDQEALARTMQQLEEQENLYRIILDTLPVNVFVKDEAQRYLMVNDSAAALLGLPKDQVRGRTDFDLFAAETADRLRAADGEVIAGLKHVIDENVVSLRGTDLYMLAHKRGVELGGRRMLIGASMDISSRRLIEQRLADENEVLELIAGNAGQAEILETICRRLEQHLHGGIAAIQVLDDTGRFLRHGAAPHLPPAYMNAIDGLEIGPGVGSCGAAAYLGGPVIVEDIATDSRWKAFRELAEQHGLRACWSIPILSAKRKVLGTFAIYYRSSRYPVALELELVQQGTRLAAIAIERAQASAQLHRMATIDALTGLANRQHFFGLAQRELARTQRGAHPLAAFMIDVDHFKPINDTHGHAVGDIVLRTLAARFGEGTRGTDICGRLGGEEFAVILPDTDRETALHVAERLRAAVARTPFAVGDALTLSVTVSIGVAMLSPGDDLDKLLARTDEALYAAKNGGRNVVMQA
jgi:diguanylate cyclase (GGDEF)-like protein/PAS domain S-box-containing protein